jgi:Concanavalin A-like lectin/glucanases superfamily
MRAVKTIVGLAAAILLAAAVPAAGASVLPVGVWPLNEGKGTAANDISGHRDNGSLEGLAQWTKGRFQDGVAFNGNAAAVNVPGSPVLEPTTVSVSAWVDSATSPGNDKYIVAKGANGCLAASYGLYTGVNGGLQFYASSNQGLSWTISPDAGQSVWNGQWHHVVGTYDGSSVRLFLDGRQVGSGTPDTAPIAYGLPTSNDLQIGNYPGCSGLGFSGSIDEVKVFDRALGSGEIALGYGLSRLIPTSFPLDLIL